MQLSISVSTVADYIARARQADVNWSLPDNMTEQILCNKLFLPVDSEIKQRVLPDMEWIHREVRKKGMTLRLLWREYPL